MKVFVILIVGVFIALLAAVASLAMTRRTPSYGQSQRETRVVTGFSRIEVDGVAEVRLRQGKTEGATIEAPPQLLSRMRTIVRDGTLIIDLAQERQWSDWMHWSGAKQVPRVTVDFIKIDLVETAGAVKLAADSLRGDELRFDFAGASTVRIKDLQASRLRVDGSGATKVELAGKVGSQSVDLSGAGSYAALDLESDRAEVHVSGAGKAYVNAKTSLSVEISGAGLVEYLGNPKVEKDISGVGKVRRREPD
jgi:Putative auto-transporter adhesin, head GIN domain